eukprot:557468-Pyramimonas_sp.AAC.1
MVRRASANPVCSAVVLRVLPCSCVFCRAPESSAVLLCVLRCSCLFCNYPVCCVFCRGPVLCRAFARAHVSAVV